MRRRRLGVRDVDTLLLDFLAAERFLLFEEALVRLGVLRAAVWEAERCHSRLPRVVDVDEGARRRAITNHSGDDTDVRPGQTYYYVVTAVDRAKRANESVPSQEASATLP